MGKEEARKAAKAFTLLARRTLAPTFRFPGGQAASDAVSACLAALAPEGRMSDERIVDFCVCQAYAASRFGKGYLPHWKVSHSFGKKALERFAREKKGLRYYEDAWLASHRTSREELLYLIRDRTRHPQAKFIYPEYEDRTKERALGTEAGYWICAVSTLLWTPLSPVCRRCGNSKACEERTRLTYPELYRLRKETKQE